MIEYAYVVVLFPLLTFITIIFFSRILKERSAHLACINLFISTILSLLILIEVINGKELEKLFLWFRISKYTFNLGFIVDPLSAMMLFVVSCVSFLIHIYSIGYMAGDKRFTRFFAYLSLFTFAMLSLVISNNFLQFYVFWELVGLCSYLLISFWFERAQAARAGMKAFIVTRFGDIGFFIGIMIILFYCGSLDFKVVFSKIQHTSPFATHSSALLMIAPLFLFCGAIGKSAQVPLHIWLPDAMEGPTPVSALIHAATMVAAGVYMVARLFNIFSAADVPLLVVAYIGAITLFLSATIAVVTNDIKRVLAYSTISQLGYMMLALGVSSVAASSFHLMTHAFFKALLFLCAGSVIHAIHTNEIWQMGKLYNKMKITCVTFIIGSLALIGIPPFAGFFSKDEIIVQTFEYAVHHHHYLLIILALGGVFLTAFYMSRVCFIVFFSDKEAAHYEHIHESPPVMTIPLIILSGFAIISGFIGSGLTGYQYQKFIYGEHSHSVHQVNIPLIILSTTIGISGILSGYLIYQRKVFNQKILKDIFPYTYKLLKNKYYFDEFYTFTLIKPLVIISRLFAKFDLFIIDGIVNFVGWFILILSKLDNIFDTYIVDGLVNFIAYFTKKWGSILRLIQTGLVQNYMLIIVIGLVLLIIWMVF